MEASYSYLKDFDWSLRLVLSSERLSGLRKPLLMLKLDTVLPDGSLQEKLIEMDADELDRLIVKLTAVQAVLRR